MSRLSSIPESGSVFFMSEIRIFKFPERKLYAKVPNYAAQDPRLSFGAKGLLTYLLSLPDNFIVYKKNIIKYQNIKRRLLDNYFEELETFRYVVPSEEQDKNAGQFGAKDYKVFPVPDNNIELIYNSTPMLPGDITDVPTVHRSDVPARHQNEISPYSINKEINTTKRELAKQVLGVVSDLKVEYSPKEKKIELKLTQQRIAKIIARQKDFYDQWGAERNFLKACRYAFEYKAREWIGTDMWKHFNPDTLLGATNFVKYLEQAEANNGKPPKPPGAAPVQQTKASLPNTYRPA